MTICTLEVHQTISASFNISSPQTSRCAEMSAATYEPQTCCLWIISANLWPHCTYSFIIGTKYGPMYSHFMQRFVHWPCLVNWLTTFPPRYITPVSFQDGNVFILLLPSVNHCWMLNCQKEISHWLWNVMLMFDKYLWYVLNVIKGRNA